MSRTHRRYDDDDTMRDGERRRVPMMAMDSVQRAIAATKQKLADDAGSTEVSDAFGNSSPAAMSRPGYRLMTGDAAVTAQQEVARRLTAPSGAPERSGPRPRPRAWRGCCRDGRASPPRATGRR